MVGEADRSIHVTAKEQRRADDMKQSIVESIIAARAQSKTLRKPSHH